VIHETADVSESAHIGEGTKIWHHAHVRENAVIGKNCVLSKNVYIDYGVIIGNNVKIQNNVSVYHGVGIEDGVFIGPHVCFTNDKRPRAINPDGTAKSAGDWHISRTWVRRGASIGARAVLLPGITIGEWAMVGAGSIITKDVPRFALVVGSPARLIGYVCKCGNMLSDFCETCAVRVDEVMP
jgi:UDP-2-acetamido-3-amino-2,3-dideoxy-glucuronate N-acetyltransferase